jgi:hypothetical protein
MLNSSLVDELVCSFSAVSDIIDARIISLLFPWELLRISEVAISGGKLERGAGLLFINFSTMADVTLGGIGGAKVLANGGTIGINGIGCGGFILVFIAGTAKSFAMFFRGFVSCS